MLHIETWQTPSNSDYGIPTAFFDASRVYQYPGLKYAPTNHNLGQIITHEFFGHLFNALFVGFNTEVSAMYEENVYNFLFGFTQRRSYGWKNHKQYIAPIIK